MTEFETPIAERLGDVPPPVVPGPVAGVTWRAGTGDDLDALAALEEAFRDADHPAYLVSRSRLAEWAGYSHVDVRTDLLVGIDADGAPAAYGLVSLNPSADPQVESILNGGVRPDLRGRGVGRALLGWQRERALEQLATRTERMPAWTVAFVDEGNPGAARLLERSGFSAERYFVSMERDLAEPIPAIEVAGGDVDVRVVPFTAELSESARLARNDAFRDHWGSPPTNEEVWSRMVGGDEFSIPLSRVAVADIDGRETVVGFGLVEVNRVDWERQGFTSAYIDYIGVSRAFRRRRIAPAILAALFEAFAAEGLDRALLDVDAASPTGADGLYAGLGFRPTTRETVYVAER